MKLMTATNPVRIVKNMITVFGGGGGGEGTSEGTVPGSSGGTVVGAEFERMRRRREEMRLLLLQLRPPRHNGSPDRYPPQLDQSSATVRCKVSILAP